MAMQKRKPGESSIAEQKAQWAYEDRQIAIRQRATNRRLEEMAKIQRKKGISYGQQQYAKYRELCQTIREEQKRRKNEKHDKEGEGCQE